MVLYYDCFSGISGDMHLSAMIDLGVPVTYLNDELQKLNLGGFSLEITPDQRQGISGTRVHVQLEEEKSPVRHRHLSDINQIIEKSTLNNTVKELSLKMFRMLAEVEAKVHGTSISKVHFHEVGAIDSIIDIVGAAVCLDYLKADKIICSPVELGNGLVKCEHGIFPVPAPATAELLKGIPVKTGNQAFEATTPTGAVILACNVDEFGKIVNFKSEKVGYGIGHKTSELPNVLRIFQGELDQSSIKQDAHSIIECNIDDMNPELLEYIMDLLFEAGADDVFISPIIMKKSRNGSKLSVLCHQSKKSILTDILIRESSTFGLRTYHVEKTELDRSYEEVQIKFGKVKIKKAIHAGKIIKQKPEYEDCAKLARANNIPIGEVYREIEKVLNS